MKALVFHGVGDIRLDNVSDPKLKEDTDAIVRITTAAICGTDLHMIRGTLPGMKPGTILGHEGVGIVEEVGREVRDFKPGDRVVISGTVACGYCSYCRHGYYSMCDNANPVVPKAGGVLFGGPFLLGGLNGLQAEKVRVPFANVTLFRLPDEITDDQGIFLSDILPSAYFASELAEIKPGNTVAIFGSGPVGILTGVCAKHLFSACRVFITDRIPSRLELAKKQGLETINFDEVDPVQEIRRLTGGIGVDRAIDAVGVDAEPPQHGPAAKLADIKKCEYSREMKEVAPETHPKKENWRQGRAPMQALTWAIESLAKAGSLSIIGFYPETAEFFPIGKAFNKNITIKMGHCNHRKYIPKLIELVRSGALYPERILTQATPLENIIDAYKSFDTRQPCWVKVEVVPSKHLVSAK
jgi:threonine dehydrogenase-like Zn-dependent dehydrogenase